VKLPVTSAAWLLLALAVGMLIGIVVAGQPIAPVLVQIFEPIGTVWVNMIRMTVLPLVVATVLASLLAPGVAQTAARLGTRALVLTLVLLIGASAVTLALAPLLFSLVYPGGDASSLAAAAQAPSGAQDVTLTRWLIELVPANPVRAAADGAMLPLLVFVAFFAFAASRLQEDRRALIRRGAEAVSEAMFVVVRWVLAVAPIGVFALALVLGTRLAAGAAAAMLAYVAIVVVFCGVVAAVLYVLVTLATPTRLFDFARAAAPGQAVALSARASLAALPAMIEGAERIRIAPAIRSFFLPLAASVFRMGTAVWIPIAVLFLARLYGVTLGPPQFLSVLILTPLLTYSVPSIPAGSLLISAPALSAAGLPLEGLGILLAVDTIPDMVRTALNVTGHMTVATILNARRTVPVTGQPL
jgi:proton glutamate symport protein